MKTLASTAGGQNRDLYAIHFHTLKQALMIDTQILQILILKPAVFIGVIILQITIKTDPNP
jgi:hypothetical protein